MSNTVYSVVAVLRAKCASNVFVQPLPYIAAGLNTNSPASLAFTSCKLCELYVRRNASAMPLCGTDMSSPCKSKLPVPTFTITWPPPGTFCS
ncbi:MAG TPA: hypothetical protein VGD01_13960 [Candidatus Elarobacter sp.]